MINTDALAEKIAWKIIDDIKARSEVYGSMGSMLARTMMDSWIPLIKKELDAMFK
jgi:hypothetical protein